MNHKFILYTLLKISVYVQVYLVSLGSKFNGPTCFSTAVQEYFQIDLALPYNRKMTDS